MSDSGCDWKLGSLKKLECANGQSTGWVETNPNYFFGMGISTFTSKEITFFCRVFG